jgi:hypothetical protein
MIKIAISFSNLSEFEYIKEGNKMPNVKEKLIELVGEKRLNDFISRSQFSDGLHVISTLILNAKRHINGNWGSFGMQYSDMVCVTYHNNSSPNLLEFYIIRND